LTEIETTFEEEIEITEESEEETYKPPPERTETTLLETLVCVHNIISALSPFISAPSIKFEVSELTPHLNVPLVSYLNVYNCSPTININAVKTP
jgi:hypothetical protein